MTTNRHGTISKTSQPGSVLCESDPRRVMRYLAPQEVILATQGTPGSIAIVVGSCCSGSWVTTTQSLTVITRYNVDGEVLSLPGGSSEKYRG